VNVANAVSAVASSLKDEDPSVAGHTSTIRLLAARAFDACFLEIHQEDIPIPKTAHEYNIRKHLNDAAYRGLDYVAFDPNMPIAKEGCPTDEAKWMWVRKRAELQPHRFFLSPTEQWLSI
jgi:hypothetical protein